MTSTPTTTDHCVPLPDDWEAARAHIHRVLDEHFAPPRATRLRDLLEKAWREGAFDEHDVTTELERLVDLEPGSEAAGALTLAMARLVGTSIEFFDERPSLGPACGRLAAAAPCEFGERSRILHSDVLYNHYRRAVAQATANGGVDAVIELVEDLGTFASTELGHWALENALLA